MVRGAIDALNRRDVDAALKDAGPDFELDFSRAINPVLHGVLGIDLVPQVIREFFESWEFVEYGVDEFIEAGEHVVTPFTGHFRGRDGIEVQSRAAWVWTYREGTWVRLTLYQERQEALEAVGLPE